MINTLQIHSDTPATKCKPIDTYGRTVPWTHASKAHIGERGFNETIPAETNRWIHMNGCLKGGHSDSLILIDLAITEMTTTKTTHKRHVMTLSWTLLRAKPETKRLTHLWMVKLWSPRNASDCYQTNGMTKGWFDMLWRSLHLVLSAF